MSTANKHQCLVFSDPKALSFLEHDPCATIVEKRQELVGYELFLVEQWACSRDYLTAVITTFSGLAHHKLAVGVVKVPANEEQWSDRLRTYIQNISKPYGRRKETPLGILMVTNLGNLPSTLTVIAVPEGDLQRYRDNFIVSENLKRLGCSGRSGLNFSLPTGATQAKFRQLYHTSNAVPVNIAAIELVRLCQSALVLFTLFTREYVDGLLCDTTTAALKQWWAEFGLEYFHVEPNDGILGPTTVAALLGMLHGARLRLHSLNAPVGKDVFDLRATKRGIGIFQKWYKLERTRRLDRETLDRLHKNSSKAVHSEGWAVPRAVKSTIPQLGKGGEMVMGMVSNRDRGGVADVETMDIINFISAATGNYSKWLWHGKPRKPTVTENLSGFSSEDELVFSGDENPPAKAHRKRDSLVGRNSAQFSDAMYAYASESQLSLDPSDKDQMFRRNMLKSVTGRMNDARSGLGRFRDAVGISGFRGHSSKLSKEQIAVSSELLDADEPVDRQVSMAHRAETWIPATDHDVPNLEIEEAVSSRATIRKSIIGEGVSSGPINEQHDVKQSKDTTLTLETSGSSRRVDSHVDSASTATDSLINDDSRAPKTTLNHISILKRSRSNIEDESNEVPREITYSKSLNYEDADAALNNHDLLWEALKTPIIVPQQESFTLEAQGSYWSGFKTRQRMKENIMENNILKEANRHIQRIAEIDSQTYNSQEKAHNAYVELLVGHEHLQQATRNCVSGERAALNEILSKIEGVIAKLEYELGMLTSKVEDVEDGIAEFADQVVNLEQRARNLEADEDGAESPWFQKWLKAFFGIK